MPSKTLKWLPRFSADNVISVIDHIEVLEKAFRDNEITHEDVDMKLLANSLEGNAYCWYSGLRYNCIIGYDDIVKKLKEEWECCYDDKFLLRQLDDVKKKDNEDVLEFNIRFKKIVEKIPDDVKPPKKTITLHFMNAINTTFSFMLKQ